VSRGGEENKGTVKSPRLTRRAAYKTKKKKIGEKMAVTRDGKTLPVKKGKEMKTEKDSLAGEKINLNIKRSTSSQNQITRQREPGRGPDLRGLCVVEL